MIVKSQHLFLSFLLLFHCSGSSFFVHRRIVALRHLSEKGQSDDFIFSFLFDLTQWKKWKKTTTLCGATHFFYGNHEKVGPRQLQVDLGPLWPRPHLTAHRKVLSCRPLLPWDSCDLHKQEREDETWAHLVLSFHIQSQPKCEVNCIGSQTAWGKPCEEGEKLKQFHQTQAGYLL